MHITEPRTALTQSLERAGYYPAFVAHVVDTALAGENISQHYVHVETTFLGNEVRRHVTVLVLTNGRLLVAHVDDHPAEGPDGGTVQRATATTESVNLAAIRSVVMTHTVAQPESFIPGQTPVEVSLAIGWGAMNRLDLEPAACPDPNCEADHGYTGQMASDDVMLRVSAEAEGEQAVLDLIDFGQALTAATQK